MRGSRGSSGIDDGSPSLLTAFLSFAPVSDRNLKCVAVNRDLTGLDGKGDVGNCV